MGKKKAKNRIWRRTDSGTVAIEFGLLVPVLLALIGITAELGFAMYESMQVNNAVGSGALYAAKNGYDASGISAAVTGATGTPGITATPAPTQFCGCPGASGITVTTCLSPPPCTDGSRPGRYVRINASLSHQTILPNVGLPLPATLTAHSIVRLD
ncbi:MAG TPA: TadE/TadG family type IV pilus assembly protein [Pseudolabrys sp.]|nr:TadE/TadG family type IV pilus assembly protein [Pseudolabrys sp.]